MFGFSLEPKERCGQSRRSASECFATCSVMLRSLLSASVLALRRVQAFISQPQSLHRPPAHNMRLDNLIHVGQRHAAIPHRFRIDNEVWAMLALVETAGVIRPHFSL